jgi:hypothetical protein
MTESKVQREERGCLLSSSTSTTHRWRLNFAAHSKYSNISNTTILIFNDFPG